MHYTGNGVCPRLLHCRVVQCRIVMFDWWVCLAALSSRAKAASDSAVADTSLRMNDLLRQCLHMSDRMLNPCADVPSNQPHLAGQMC
jgi:hypothetical protein